MSMKQGLRSRNEVVRRGFEILLYIDSELREKKQIFLVNQQGPELVILGYEQVLFRNTIINLFDGKAPASRFAIETVLLAKQQKQLEKMTAFPGMASWEDSILVGYHLLRFLREQMTDYQEIAFFPLDRSRPSARFPLSLLIR